MSGWSAAKALTLFSPSHLDPQSEHCFEVSIQSTSQVSAKTQYSGPYVGRDAIRNLSRLKPVLMFGERFLLGVCSMHAEGTGTA